MCFFSPYLCVQVESVNVPAVLVGLVAVLLLGLVLVGVLLRVGLGDQQALAEALQAIHEPGIVCRVQ